VRTADIVTRSSNPGLGADGGTIPWNDPEFSKRMLAEHLDQSHHMASRKLDKIDAHVRWMHERLLSGDPARILDLGCGPGFYCTRLTAKGHRCTGIDFSPASVEYAREHVSPRGVPGGSMEIMEGDILEIEYGGPYDFVLFVYGELNAFRQRDAERILRKAWKALRPGGLLLLEPHTYEGIAGRRTGTSWHSAEKGLFADDPYLCLIETNWIEAAQTTVDRYYVIHVADDSVTYYSSTHRAYKEDEYRHMLTRAGFDSVDVYPSLLGVPDPEQAWLCAVTAVRPVG
jgi:SAM-dependent methyltransferase